MNSDTWLNIWLRLVNTNEESLKDVDEIINKKATRLSANKI